MAIIIQKLYQVS